MCDVVCTYKDQCTEYSKSCQSCKRNTGKRNYYLPDYDPYYPPLLPYVYPSYPYAPVWCQWTTTWNGNNVITEPLTICTPQTSYYQSVD